MVYRGITKGWPPERRAKQAALCRKNKPSKHATGPKTEEGKAASSNNAYKHGLRSAEMKEIESLLTQQAKFTKKIRESFT